MRDLNAVTADIVDAAVNHSWQLEKVAVSAVVPASGAGAIEVRGSLGVAGDAAAKLAAECKRIRNELFIPVSVDLGWARAGAVPALVRCEATVAVRR